jgi:3-oxoacyl-[acyl-carrier-protein] synthase-3
MLGTIENVGIDCLTATISKNRVPVAEHCAGLISEKKAARLAKNTGFTHLSIAAPGICTSDFCVEAAERLFVAGAKKNEIGAVIFISQTPDYPRPATSFIIQHRLGLSTDVIAFDISLGCSGFVYGIYVAASMLSNMGKNILICAGDTPDALKSDDISGLAINGAAGAAAILGRRNASHMRNIHYHITSYGDKYQTLICKRGGARAPRITNATGELLPTVSDNFAFMDGAEVMNFSTYEAYENVHALLEYSHLDAEELDVAFLHQANLTIVDTLRERLGIAAEKTPFASCEVGNTSSASIPVCMAEMKRLGQYVPPKRALLSGFGIGMSAATVVMDLSETKILETGAL